MPSYAGILSEREIGRVVAYVASLPPAAGVAATPSSSSARALLAVDPVCNMQVRVDDATPRELFDGGSYFFCSDACRRAFVHDPTRYLRDAPAP